MEGIMAHFALDKEQNCGLDCTRKARQAEPVFEPTGQEKKLIEALKQTVRKSGHSTAAREFNKKVLMLNDIDEMSVSASPSLIINPKCTESPVLSHLGGFADALQTHWSGVNSAMNSYVSFTGGNSAMTSFKEYKEEEYQPSAQGSYMGSQQGDSAKVGGPSRLDSAKADTKNVANSRGDKQQESCQFSKPNSACVAEGSSAASKENSCPNPSNTKSKTDFKSRFFSFASFRKWFGGGAVETKNLMSMNDSSDTSKPDALRKVYPGARKSPGREDCLQTPPKIFVTQATGSNIDSPPDSKFVTFAGDTDFSRSVDPVSFGDIRAIHNRSGINNSSTSNVPQLNNSSALVSDVSKSYPPNSARNSKETSKLNNSNFIQHSPVPAVWLGGAASPLNYDDSRVLFCHGETPNQELPCFEQRLAASEKYCATAMETVPFHPMGYEFVNALNNSHEYSFEEPEEKDENYLRAFEEAQQKMQMEIASSRHIQKAMSLSERLGMSQLGVSQSSRGCASPRWKKSCASSRGTTPGMTPVRRKPRIDRLVARDSPSGSPSDSPRMNPSGMGRDSPRIGVSSPNMRAGQYAEARHESPTKKAVTSAAVIPMCPPPMTKYQSGIALLTGMSTPQRKAAQERGFHINANYKWSPNKEEPLMKEKGKYIRPTCHGDYINETTLPKPPSNTANMSLERFEKHIESHFPNYLSANRTSNLSEFDARDENQLQEIFCTSNRLQGASFFFDKKVEEEHRRLSSIASSEEIPLVNELLDNDSVTFSEDTRKDDGTGKGIIRYPSRDSFSSSEDRSLDSGVGIPAMKETRFKEGHVKDKEGCKNETSTMDKAAINRALSRSATGGSGGSAGLLQSRTVTYKSNVGDDDSDSASLCGSAPHSIAPTHRFSQGSMMSHLGSVWSYPSRSDLFPKDKTAPRLSVNSASTMNSDEGGHADYESIAAHIRHHYLNQTRDSDLFRPHNVAYDQSPDLCSENSFAQRVQAENERTLNKKSLPIPNLYKRDLPVDVRIKLHEITETRKKVSKLLGKDVRELEMQSCNLNQGKIKAEHKKIWRLGNDYDINEESPEIPMDTRKLRNNFGSGGPTLSSTLTKRCSRASSADSLRSNKSVTFAKGVGGLGG